MAHHFHYDSRDHHLPFNRTKRFAIFMTVLFSLSLALNFTYLYFTDWSHAEDASSNRLYLFLGILMGLLALAGVAVVVTNLLRKQGYTNYQYITLTGHQLKWQFNALKGPQEIDLSKVDYVLSDPRHLIFKMANEEIWLENYLIIDEGEWEKFLTKLRTLVTVK